MAKAAPVPRMKPPVPADATPTRPGGQVYNSGVGLAYIRLSVGFAMNFDSCRPQHFFCCAAGTIDAAAFTAASATAFAAVPVVATSALECEGSPAATACAAFAAANSLLAAATAAAAAAAAAAGLTAYAILAKRCCKD